MSAVERIEAALDEAEKRLDARPWVGATDLHGDTCVVYEDGGLITGPVESPHGDLIVSVVNRERAQIQHARDVLARHGGEHWCPRLDNDGESVYDEFVVHVDADCQDIASLLAVWCPEPTP